MVRNDTVVLLDELVGQLLQEMFVTDCNTCPGFIGSGRSAIVIRKCLAGVLQAQGELSGLTKSRGAWPFKLAILVNGCTLLLRRFLWLTDGGDIFDSTVFGTRFDKDHGQSASCGMPHRCIGAVDDFPDR